PTRIPMVEVYDSIVSVLIRQGIRSRELVPTREALVDLNQQRIVYRSAAGSPESDLAIRAFDSRCVLLGCGANRNHRRADAVDVSIVTIVVDLAEQRIEVHAADEIHVEHQVMAKLPLYPEIKMQAVLHRVVLGIELRSGLVDVDVAD